MQRRRPRKRKALPDLSIDPSKLNAYEYRSEQFNIKLTPKELESIRSMAKSLGVPVVDYLVGLHNQAVEAISRKKR